MADTHSPGRRYWALVEPVWRSINIYDGPDVFLTGFRAVRPEVGHLFTAHWCQSEVRNGGFHQFFSNSTGVLAPEALAGFRAIGSAQWADILAEAVALFGDPYPRDRADRLDRLDRLMAANRGRRKNRGPFYALDDRFYHRLHAEPDRWEQAADAYAASAGG
ncbi:MAG: DMP19 family protein [Gemmataceae bacterium]|nr:DMP19 family protein [Gemmataceae bacterium]